LALNRPLDSNLFLSKRELEQRLLFALISLLYLKLNVPFA
jgi:hypothetical protein